MRIIYGKTTSNNIENKIFKNIGTLYKVRDYLNTIRTNLKKISRQQKHAIHIIFHKDKFSHSKELFEQNKVFNADQLNIFNNFIFTHEVKTENTPSVFLSKFQKPAHPYSTNFSERKSKIYRFFKS